MVGGSVIWFPDTKYEHLLADTTFLKKRLLPHYHHTRHFVIFPCGINTQQQIILNDEKRAESTEPSK
jgi:hypothetical protein